MNPEVLHDYHHRVGMKDDLPTHEAERQARNEVGICRPCATEQHAWCVGCKCCRITKLSGRGGR